MPISFLSKQHRQADRINRFILLRNSAFSPPFVCEAGCNGSNSQAHSILCTPCCIAMPVQSGQICIRIHNHRTYILQLTNEHSDCKLASLMKRLLAHAWVRSILLCAYCGTPQWCNECGTKSQLKLKDITRKRQVFCRSYVHTIWTKTKQRTDVIWLNSRCVFTAKTSGRFLCRTKTKIRYHCIIQCSAFTPITNLDPPFTTSFPKHSKCRLPVTVPQWRESFSSGYIHTMAKSFPLNVLESCLLIDCSKQSQEKVA